MSQGLYSPTRPIVMIPQSETLMNQIVCSNCALRYDLRCLLLGLQPCKAPCEASPWAICRAKRRRAEDHGGCGHECLASAPVFELQFKRTSETVPSNIFVDAKFGQIFPSTKLTNKYNILFFPKNRCL